MRTALRPSHVKERWSDSHRVGSLCPNSERVTRAKRHARESPGAGKQHAGKYGEWTPSRQRGGGGVTATPLPARQEAPIWALLLSESCLRFEPPRVGCYGSMLSEEE